jgi:hypothetical protein
VTPKPTNYDFLASYIFNGTEIFTTGHSAISNSEYTGGILVRNGYNWEYTACYPYSVITIESLTYVPHLGKILGVGGGTVVTFDPKNISSGCVATSINGAYRLQAIAAGNGVILAENLDSSLLFTSVTGTYWKQVDKLPFRDFHGLIYDNTFNRFMVNCQNGTFVSENGNSWIKLPSNNDTLTFVTMKMYANNLVATGYGRRVYISENKNSSLYWRDISPINITMPFYFFYFPLTTESGSSIFVGLSDMPSFDGGFNTSIWRSEDFGNSWQLVWRRNNSFVPATILRSRNEWLIGCQGGKLLSTSDWTTYTAVFPAYTLTTETFHHVSYVNNQFILSGDHSTYTSVDGYSWNKISDDGFYSITYSPISKLFVGIPNVGIKTSPDLKNWTLATIDQNDNRNLYFSHIPTQTKEGYLMVSGQIGSVWYGTGLWLSQDGGVTWLKLPQKFSTSVCGQFLAALGYANNTVYVSCPGAYSMTLSTTNITSNSWQRVNNDWFMFMTGGAGSVQDTLVALRLVWGSVSLYQITNGKWLVTQKFQGPIESSDPLPRNQLFLNGKFWTLFRSGQAFSSTDGQSWTPETINMYGIRHMTYAHGRYVAVGDYGTILVGKDTN